MPQILGFTALKLRGGQAFVLCRYGLHRRSRGCYPEVGHTPASQTILHNSTHITCHVEFACKAAEYQASMKPRAA